MTDRGHAVLVTGGRDFPDRHHVWRVLRALHRILPIHDVMHGGCPSGVDRFVSQWVQHVKPHLSVNEHIYLPNWVEYNRAAGPIRNRQMADVLQGWHIGERRPATVLVFPGGRGTASMERAARERRLPVVLAPLNANLDTLFDGHDPYPPRRR